MQHCKRIVLFALVCISAFLMTATALDLDETSESPIYTAMIPVTEQGPIRTSSISNSETILEGKSILFFGDSLTSGYGMASYDDSWCGMLETEYGMNVTMCSVGGSTMATSSIRSYTPGGCYSPIVERTLPSGNYDIIFLDGGFNDWCCEIPLGDSCTSTDPYTFMGAFNCLVTRLQNAYPDALIICTTGWESGGSLNGIGLSTSDYWNALIQVCQYRDIPCFIACDTSISGIYSNDENFRRQYFISESDHCHLNSSGNALYLPTIASWLEEELTDCLCVSGFCDVYKTAWYAEAVQYVCDKGLMIGVDSNRFAPDTSMDRAMMVTVLYRMAGSPPVEDYNIPFADVVSGAYYEDAVCWAYQNGITNGVDETHFNPDGILTREECVTFLYRMESEGNGTDNLRDSEVLTAFPDYTDISEFAVQAMEWAVNGKILIGTDENQLLPKGTATRAEIATILQRYID